jgi:DNA-damage-inducible protein D
MYGVIESSDYAVFQNAGYRGLYNGKTKQDIAKHKVLSKKDDILDHMGSVELAANWFRVTQTEEQLKKDGIHGKQNANKTHFEVGKRVRDTMVNKPENLPVAENIKKVEQKQKKLEKDELNENKKITNN